SANVKHKKKGRPCEIDTGAPYKECHCARRQPVGCLAQPPLVTTTHRSPPFARSTPPRSATSCDRQQASSPSRHDSMTQYPILNSGLRPGQVARNIFPWSKHTRPNTIAEKAYPFSCRAGGLSIM